ncbi:hypothetical protein G9A89_023894 [Geosiphon pyriformis]|nr:hypothetical protein G9A89_023894 [Geosiphon pyriformis]
MEEDFEESFWKPSRPPPPPPTTPTSTFRDSFSWTNTTNLPYSLPSLLFRRTLNPRINNKHQDITRAKLKKALERELREDKLREVSGRGDYDSVINLLNLNPLPDINRPDEKGRTPLHFACAGGHVDIVKLLISRHANVNADPDVVGNRPLHLAVISNKLECVVALLEAGAKIYMDDAFHRTPLSVARSRLSILMKNILTENGSSENKQLTTAFMSVESPFDSNNVQILEEREVFRQVLQITKILRHYVPLQNADLEIKEYDISLVADSPPTNKESSTQTIDTLDSLTAQLSKLVMKEDRSSHEDMINVNKGDSESLVCDATVLNQVQDVLETLIQKQTL